MVLERDKEISVGLNFSLASNDFVDEEKRTTFFELTLYKNSFRNFVGYLKKETVEIVWGSLRSNKGQALQEVILYLGWGILLVKRVVH